MTIPFALHNEFYTITQEDCKHFTSMRIYTINKVLLGVQTSCLVGPLNCGAIKYGGDFFHSSIKFNFLVFHHQLQRIKRSHKFYDERGRCGTTKAECDVRMSTSCLSDVLDGANLLEQIDVDANDFHPPCKSRKTSQLSLKNTSSESKHPLSVKLDGKIFTLIIKFT